MIINKTFTLIKTISYDGENHMKEKLADMNRLKQSNFNRIKIPNFTYNIFNNVLSIHMELIKGEQLNKYNRDKFKRIIWEDLVCRPEPFSVAGYHPSNFIYSNNLYFVDLEDIRLINYKDRIIKFKKDFYK